jgi:hypothetical protein
MSGYFLGLYSFAPKEPGAIARILSIPTIRRLVFPAKFPTAVNAFRRLEHPGEYSFALLPDGLHPKPGFRLPLYTENGMKFDITGYPEGTIIPSLVGLEFDTTHLEQGQIDIQDLTTLLAEVVPVFHVDCAVLRDTYQVKIPNQQGGYGSERPKYYRSPNGRHYLIGLEWITFYGPQLLEYIGRERFGALRTFAEKYELDGGIVVILQEEPFRNDDPQHRERRAQAEAELRLNELVTK